jgi:hypothetical protein
MHIILCILEQVFWFTLFLAMTVFSCTVAFAPGGILDIDWPLFRQTFFFLLPYWLGIYAVLLALALDTRVGYVLAEFC